MYLESIVSYLDSYLDTSAWTDYPNALNGLQVDGPAEVTRVAAAVDGSEETIRSAVASGADLLLVHHGLFWGGLSPLRGPFFRKVQLLIQHGVALYSSHLPLDAHPEVGNSALLAAELGLPTEDRFGRPLGGEGVGWIGSSTPIPRDTFAGRVEVAVGGPVRVIPGGPAEVRRVALITGGGGSLIQEAVRCGADTLVTGEGAHHTYAEAMEAGLNVFYAGHYRTETFGVRALAAHLEARFGLPWVFLDHPSGL